MLLPDRETQRDIFVKVQGPIFASVAARSDRTNFSINVLSIARISAMRGRTAVIQGDRFRTVIRWHNGPTHEDCKNVMGSKQSHSNKGTVPRKKLAANFECNSTLFRRNLAPWKISHRPYSNTRVIALIQMLRCFGTASDQQCAEDKPADRRAVGAVQNHFNHPTDKLYPWLTPPLPSATLAMLTGGERLDLKLLIVSNERKSEGV